jgi:branched-chain amino acid transport system substrate-binding protein
MAAVRPGARRFRAVAVAIMAVVALGAAACGDDDDQEQEDDAGAPAKERVATIGVVAPLEDGLVDFGLGIRNAVELAVDAANEADAVPGWGLEVRALDDSSDPGKGRAAAEELAADDSVIGVVGTYNSGVAQEVAPVLDEAGIVMISPGNTDPTLTLGEDPANPERPYEHYFRMVAADDVQGPFLAQQAAGPLGFATAAVISETKPVSKGLADVFADEFPAAGGRVVHRAVVPDGSTDFADVVATVAPMQPDVVFFGGEYEVAAALRREASAAGLDAPLMGGDGMKDDAYIEGSGEDSEGDLASSIGRPLSSSTTARDFVVAYEEAGFEEDATDFGPYAFDAANTIIAAAADALADEDSVTGRVRDAILDAVQATDTTGASGPVAFDELGDTRTKVLTLYRVQDGAWAAQTTEEVS